MPGAYPIWRHKNNGGCVKTAPPKGEGLAEAVSTQFPRSEAALQTSAFTITAATPQSRINTGSIRTWIAAEPAGSQPVLV